MRPYVFLLATTVLAAPFRILVLDPSGTPIPDPTIEIRTPSGTPVEAPVARAGRYQIRITAPGFAPVETLTFIGADTTLTLHPETVYTRIAVTAARGSAEETHTSPHVSVVKELPPRPIATLGNALEREAGILVQQSTYAQVSPFLRGLTGYQVLNLIDGVRFNNSTFRSGPNQYLAFVEPGQAQRTEAMLGPTGVQYGSDSLGGTIHVITSEPRFASSPGPEVHGDLSLSGASADLSAAASGRVSVSTERVFWTGALSGRKHHDLRAGRGFDSRNVYRRLFGYSFEQVRDLLGPRQQDTGFRQYGLQTKLALRPRPDHLATFHYLRGVQDDVRGYKDLLGGLGRLISTFEPQVMNWFYGRYEKLALGPFDSVSGTFSVNSQQDGSVRQNLRAIDPITRDFGRVNAFGYSAQATTHRSSRFIAAAGADAYDEHIASEREVHNPAAGAVARPRPLYPDGSRYGNFGVFGQGTLLLTQRLRASAGIRWTGVRFETPENAAFQTPATKQWFRDTTFNSSLRWQATSILGVHAVVSRGFRAPNLNDLGALGINDLGYEIPASSAIPAGALLSTDAGESALPKGQPLSALGPESLMNYEAGVTVNASRLYARVQLFNSELYDPIVRRTLLFSASNVPSSLAGLPVTPIPQTAAQRALGVVTVATGLDPRAVKAFVNDGRARYYGLESLLRFHFTRRWSVESNYTFIAGRDLNPNRNIRRLPPQMGNLALRYIPSGRRPWFEVSAAAAGAQRRLSGGDLDDERIGASRRRRDIADFYNGSRAIVPAGETLAQIMDRVLPGIDDNTRVPLYRSTAGWVTLNAVIGMPMAERWQLTAGIENIADRNYRFHGSGIDAPGRSLYTAVTFRF